MAALSPCINLIVAKSIYLAPESWERYLEANLSGHLINRVLSERSYCKMPFLSLLVTLSGLLLIAVIALILSRRSEYSNAYAWINIKRSGNQKALQFNFLAFNHMPSSLRDISDDKKGSILPSIPTDAPRCEQMVVDRRRERTERSAGFCPKCGKPIQQFDQFCPGCGEKIVR